MKITEEIKDIQYMLEHYRYESARVLLEALIGYIKSEVGPSPLKHENGHCWCGAYHEAKITHPIDTG